MITNKMRKQLGELGYSLENIQVMTPADAHAVLQVVTYGRGEEPEGNAASCVAERTAIAVKTTPLGQTESTRPLESKAPAFGSRYPVPKSQKRILNQIQ